MKPVALVSLCVFAVCWLGGCASTPKVVDLARNPVICADLPFATPAPGDRAVFVAPVVDGRRGQLPTHERGFPIYYGPDTAWDRPVTEMVGEVLQRELTESGLFAQLSTTASPQTIVIVPELTSFSMGAIESIHGARGFADVAVTLRVYGPEDAAGQRPLWLERVCSDRQVTQPQIKPANMFMLAGGATARSLAKALSLLDGSNVGRSGVPLQLGVPAEASSPTR